MKQTSIQPHDKKEAEKIAYFLIKSKYGNIPYPDTPILNEKEKIWNVPIKIRYPRILLDDYKKPKKVRFMQEKKVGEIEISSETGEIKSKPTYYELKSSINTYLESIRTTVEKALVKVGAKNFSQLPFPIHIHTPIIDILSNMLTVEKLDLSEELKILSDDDAKKYTRHIDALQKVGLVAVEGTVVFPGDLLIEIEAKGGNISKKLTNAMTIFFSRGYELIDSIRDVLGSHLTMSGIFYEYSLQYDEIIPFNLQSIENIFLGLPQYGMQRKLKIPRYLAQLESVGLIDDNINEKGEVVWCANEDIYRRILKEKELIGSLIGT